MLTFKQFINEQLIKKGNRLGSNPGGIHVDKDNKHYYVKFPNNPEQGKVEVLASRLHNLMGIKTVNPKNDIVDNKHAVVSEFNDNLEPLKDIESVHHMSSEQHKDLAKMYAAGVLLKNWDIAGSGIRYGEGNIMKHKKTNDLYSIDPGGSFHFRAQSQLKPYTSDIDEIHSLRNPNMNEGADIFNIALKNPEVEKHMVDTIKKLDDSKIHHEFKNSGLNNWKELHDTFKKRKEGFIKHYE